MFNAEKLLGKVMSEVSKSSKKVHKKYKNKDKYSHKKKHKSDDFLSGIAGQLKSGKGLVTAIGLGVGAYEILKNKKSGPAPPTASSMNTPPPAGQQQAPPPPPPGNVSSSLPPPAPGVAASPPPFLQSAASNEDGGKLAVRIIQTMIAAAYADGHLDDDEEKEIIKRLRVDDLEKEEKKYILQEFHNPKTIEELTAGISDPQIGQTMYAIAVSTIVVDTEAERAWLDTLAQHLSISKEMQELLEEE